MNQNIINGLISALGLPGQFYVRINNLNGSLDKSWLMLFCILPISLISSVCFYIDWVKL